MFKLFAGFTAHKMKQLFHFHML